MRRGAMLGPLRDHGTVESYSQVLLFFKYTKNRGLANTDYGFARISWSFASNNYGFAKICITP